MNRLRHPEERLIARDDLPLDVEAEVGEEGDAGAQELRDAAAVRGRVQVQDPGAAELSASRSSASRMWIGTTLRYEVSERSPTSTLWSRVVADVDVHRSAHWYRSASAGSTRDARSAGRSVVSSDAA